MEDRRDNGVSRATYPEAHLAELRRPVLWSRLPLRRFMHYTPPRGRPDEGQGDGEEPSDRFNSLGEHAGGRQAARARRELVHSGQQEVMETCAHRTLAKVFPCRGGYARLPSISSHTGSGLKSV